MFAPGLYPQIDPTGDSPQLHHLRHYSKNTTHTQGRRYPNLNDNNEKSGLSQAAGAAQAIQGAVKTGKAIAAAAKGAAVGGLYGAAAGLVLGAGRHAVKLFAATAVLLMLPVLFILMLPALIFGGLTSSGSPEPILNDNAAITQNISDIAFAVNQILGEGITDAEERIAQDFSVSGGDNYEIVNPYAAHMSVNTNAFIAQYCAAKEEFWETISLADMQAVLRQGKSNLYSYTRTSETRTVEADNPDTPDVVETREETWYIYTLSYNGEEYFADTVFHLTDDQKSLAGDYAQNLSVFQDDGMFQYTEYNGAAVASLGNVRFTDGAAEVVYFNQLDERWANEPYGTDNIGGYGCGPTSSEPQRIVDALSEGKLVVALMTKGHFTSGGHFIVLRGITGDGKILVADPASYQRSQKLWDLSIILNEASKGAGAGGPFWITEK